MVWYKFPYRHTVSAIATFTALPARCSRTLSAQRATHSQQMKSRGPPWINKVTCSASLPQKLHFIGSSKNLAKTFSFFRPEHLRAFRIAVALRNEQLNIAPPRAALNGVLINIRPGIFLREHRRIAQPQTKILLRIAAAAAGIIVLVIAELVGLQPPHSIRHDVVAPVENERSAELFRVEGCEVAITADNLFDGAQKCDTMLSLDKAIATINALAKILNGESVVWLRFEDRGDCPLDMSWSFAHKCYLTRHVRRSGNK
jgi:hypothetical protein